MLKETDKQAAQKELAKIFGEIMPDRKSVV